jgi:hypothetical protein
MSFTNEQREKGRATRLANREARLAAKSAAHQPPVEIPADDPVPHQVDGGEDRRALVRRKALEQIQKELAEKRAAEEDVSLERELELELHRQRVACGLKPAFDPTDLITFVVDVAPFSPGLQIDGVLYPHGQEVTLPRHRYDSFREIMARTWDHEENCGYPNKKQMRPRGQTNAVNTTMPHAYMSPHMTTISERTAAVSNRPVIARL